eukprot:7433286-Lingulodinium_polyedra.AAC.1
MLRLFGPGAAKTYEALKDDRGDMGIDCTAGRCCVVTKYKHVGTVKQTTGRLLADASHKVAKARATYAPLAAT